MHGRGLTFILVISCYIFALPPFALTQAGQSEPGIHSEETYFGRATPRFVEPVDHAKRIKHNAQAQAGNPLPASFQTAVPASGLPLQFEPNRGQTNPQVKYQSRGNRYELFLTDSEAILALTHSPIPAARNPRAGPAEANHETSIIRMQLKDAKSATIRAESILPGTVSYITGNDPRRWRTGIETYARVRYVGVYPGVDLVYYGNEGRLEFDFVVAQGADPKHICMGFTGISGLHLNIENNLILTLTDREIAFHKPVAYQEIDGIRRPVESRFRLAANNTVEFTLGEYDHSKALVIDPVLAYSTYLGGNFFDVVQALAVDQSGDAYVTGSADSCDFPTTLGSYEPLLPNCSASAGAIVVTKLNSQGTSLVYSTFVTTGNATTSGYGWAIAVDGSGNAYVAGQSGGGLPVTPGAYQPVNNAATNGGINGFVLKLNPSGTGLLYSTYLGGSYGADAIYAIAIDSGGEAYVAGTALSSDFPTTKGAFQTIDTTPGDPYSFVSKLNATGSALVYSTYLVGNGNVSEFGAPMGQANGIAVDSSGNAYVAGSTADTSFPVTPGAFQTNYSTDPSNLGLFRFTGYITKLDSSGAHELYSSYLGGHYTSEARAVAVDSSGSAYVTGWTAGDDLTTPGAFQTRAAGLDAYVVKVNPSGSALTYATYLGGSCLSAPQVKGDTGYAITIDATGDAYIAGQACSRDFPVTTNAIQTTLAGGNTNYSVFLSELNPTGTKLLFSTYLGGSYTGDWATGIGLDGLQNAYIAGLTHSFSFPTTTGAFQTQNNPSDQGTGFVSKFTIPPGGQLLIHDFALSLSASSASISKGQSTSTIVTITPSNGFYESISFSCSGVPNWADCSFSIPSVAPGTSAMTTTLTISTFAAASASTTPMSTTLSVISSMTLLCLLRGCQRKASKALALGIVLGMILVNGCGGGGGTGGAGGRNSFTVIVSGTAPSTQHMTTFTVTAD